MCLTTGPLFPVERDAERDRKIQRATNLCYHDKTTITIEFYPCMFNTCLHNAVIESLFTCISMTYSQNLCICSQSAVNVDLMIV